MIHHVFAFGVVIPTVITIVLFIVFLVCWFKFNMRERFFKKEPFKQQKKQSVAGQPLEAVNTPRASSHRGRNTDHGEDNNNRRNDSSKDRGGMRIHSQRSPSADFQEDTCSIEDPEAALCSYAVAPDRSQYLPNKTGTSSDCNHGLQTLKCPTDMYPYTHGGKNDAHVAQTFHFPAMSKTKHLQFGNVEDEDLDLEDGDYGHFVRVCDLTTGHAELKEMQAKVHLAKLDQNWSKIASSCGVQCAEECKELEQVEGATGMISGV